MRPVHRARTRLTALAVALVGGVALGAASPAVADTPATTSYVSCHSGKATGNGSKASPWSALWQVTAHGAYAPGDEILLKRGTTCTGQLAPQGSGTSIAPIVIGQWGSGARLPVLAGGGTPTRTGALQFVNVSYWTVRDLHVTNTNGNRNPYADRAGVLFKSTNGTRLAGLTASGLTVDHVDSDPNARTWGGIVGLTWANAAGFDGMRITGNHITGVGRSGIVVSNLNFYSSPDRGLRVDRNVLRWVRGDSIILDGVSDSEIDHNTSAFGSNLTDCPRSHCGRMGTTSTATAAIWPTHASNIRIDHNEVYGEHSTAGDGDGIDIDLYATNITVEQNYLHDNGRGGLEFCGARNTVARFNVLQHNAGPSIDFTCGWQKDQQVKNIAIENNTIVSAPGAAWVIRSMHPNPGAGIKFVNNLVSCFGACAYSWPPSHPTFASNTFSGSHSWSEPGGPGERDASLGLRALGRAGVGFASASGYRLKAGSRPTHGVAISGKGLRDFFGHTVSAAKPVRGAASS